MSDSENVWLKAEEQDENQRIDKYLARVMPEISRSYFQKLLKDGGVFIDGKVAKASDRLQCGDEIYFQMPKSREPDIEPEDLSLDILYEDPYLLVINKPKGMVVHPCPGHYSGTLVNGVLFHCKGQLSGINGVLRPGIVHRIDKDTTGVES